MTNVLEELYYGNLHPSAKTADPNSELANFLNGIAEYEQALTAYLATLPEAEEQRHQMQKLINAHQEVLLFTDRDRFLAGMQLGAQFIVDLLILPEKSAVQDIF